MVNVLKERIIITKNLISFYESNTPQTEYDRVFEKGYLSGLKSELKALEEMLTAAQMLQRLSA
ncbi:hypothetical protein AB1K32_15295 [Metabacillus dongyingensis]|uniref:hypothetical protein n=1 Tax=Metabacillus dongyingensis TaxID=2874282 RepID=UPI003B8D3E23